MGTTRHPVESAALLSSAGSTLCDAPEQPRTAAPATSPAASWHGIRSLQWRFLSITLPAMLVILAAFFTYLEVTQNRHAARQIENKVSQMLDSSTILLADATARQDSNRILLLLAPVLGDPDVVSIAVELPDGRQLAAYGDPLSEIAEPMIRRIPITNLADGEPATVGWLHLGLSHKRIERELSDRLFGHAVLATLIFIAVVVSTYLSLRLAVMRPMHRLLCGIETWKAGGAHEPVSWPHNDEFGQLIAAFNGMQQRQLEYQSDLRIARDAAEVADRAKTAFLAIIGHELRTPLNAIIGFSELLKEELSDAGDNGHYLDDITVSGKLLLDLVNDILEVTEANAGRLTLSEQESCLHDLVARVVIRVGEQATAEAAPIVNAIPDTLPSACIDARRMQRALFHLIGNALRATPSDGQIRIAVEQDTGGLHISVADTGSGIPEDKLASIQMPFAKATVDWRNHSEGAGVGLTYVRTVAQLHGGSLRLESALDHGTTATITLPASRLQ